MINTRYIFSDSLDRLVEKTIERNGKTYTWDDINCLYYCDNGDEEDCLMLDDDM